MDLELQTVNAAVLQVSAIAFAIVLAQLAIIVRILLRPHRDPASRIAWLVVVTTLPLLGIFAYLLLGEVSIGRRRAKRLRSVLLDLSKAEATPASAPILERHENLFRLGQSISGSGPVSGNVGCLLHDSNATINRMVCDIDAAREHVHLLFYIWLDDINGRKVIEALKRAAARGVPGHGRRPWLTLFDPLSALARYALGRSDRRK